MSTASPVYKMAMDWKVAFPLHPECRTVLKAIALLVHYPDGSVRDHAEELVALFDDERRLPELEWSVPMDELYAGVL